MNRRRIHGPAVRAIREAQGIKGSVFCIRVGISHGYLVNIEKGIKQPAPDVIRKIADELGYGIEAITYVIPECHCSSEAA